jgi:hypothetical protein
LFGARRTQNLRPYNTAANIRRIGFFGCSRIDQIAGIRDLSRLGSPIACGHESASFYRI